jgi:hypothetical protein
MKNILIVLLTLILLMLGLAWYINRNKETSTVLLTVTMADRDKTEITDFPAGAFQDVTTNTGKSLSLVPVRYCLTHFMKDESWSQMTFTSADNAQLTVKRDELDALYLAVNTKNETTWLRLIIPSDDFHQRWLKYINKIELS